MGNHTVAIRNAPSRQINTIHKSKSRSNNFHFRRHVAYCMSCNSQNTIFVLLKSPAFRPALFWPDTVANQVSICWRLNSTLGIANCCKHSVLRMLHVKLPIARLEWCPLTAKTAIWKTFCHWHVTKLSIRTRNERLQSIYWYRGYYVMTFSKSQATSSEWGKRGLKDVRAQKLPTHRFFWFFSIMERVRKGSDLPKKKWGSPSVQQKYSHTKLTQRLSALYFVEFSTRCARLKMTWHVRDQWIACALEMRSSNGHERP